MKINEQYHNLNLLENVTYEFLGRDGEAHEETEPILVEHMMNVYVNERLPMSFWVVTGKLMRKQNPFLWNT